MKIYLIRHGKTIDDTDGKQQHAQAQLDPEFLFQIDELKLKLQGIKFDQVLVSPLPRARQTASRLFDQSVELPYTFEYVRPRIIDGVDKSVAVAFWEQQYKEAKYLPDWSIDGGESFNTIVARAQQLITHLQSLPQEGTVAIVGHGVYFRHLIGRLLLGDDYTPHIFFDVLLKIDLRNCGYIKLEAAADTTKVLGIYN
jgi:broad specificity phosphatase PhoE